jgi:endonuclease YncB( thermonuclease family)
MKLSKAIFPIFFILIFSVFTLAQINYSGQVTEIVDGRTVIIEAQQGVKIKLKLENIEVPEPEQKLHQIVKDHLTKLVLNKYVQFKTKGFSDTQATGQLFINGIDISQQMIRDGAAWYALASKAGQNRFQIEEYENIETQAKAEKRGVWSIPEMKPAWEFRAEKERKRLAEIKKKQEEEIEKRRSQNRDSEERIKANANVQMWAEVNTVGYVLDSNIIAGYEYNIGSSQPFSGHSEVTRRSYIGTPLSIFNVSFENKEHKLLGMLVYYYHDKNPGTPESYYVFGLISKSPTPKFTDAETLTIIADGQTFRSIGSGRRVKKTDDGIEEFLSYGFTSQALTRIKRARRLDVTLGNYRGSVSGQFLEKIQTLLQNLS